MAPYYHLRKRATTLDSKLEPNIGITSKLGTDSGEFTEFKRFLISRGNAMLTMISTTNRMTLKRVLCIVFVSFIRLAEGNYVTLLPDGTANVLSGESLTLECIYSGQYNPFTFNFYLNPDTSGIQIRKSTCGIVISTGYNTSLYNRSCGTNSISLEILVISQSNYGQVWECDVSFITGDPIPVKDSTLIQEITTATVSSSDALCKPDGPLFVILDICIIISCIIVVILITDFIFWSKYLTFPIFKAFVKRGHQYLRTLYLLLLITVVVCEISIVIIIFIGRQCENILIVGFCLDLIIIIVTCIFLIVLIKTEVIIRHKDAIQNPRTSTDVKITASLHHIFISDVEWIGPNGNTLTTDEKYIIAQYNSDAGETSLTIKNVSQDDNGSYICQSKNGCKIAKDSIHILCDKEKRAKSTGPPAIHVGTQNKDKSETSSKQTKEKHRPLPPMSGVAEDKPRPQPSPPENIDAKDQKLRGLLANCEDEQGLPTGTPPSNRLTPLTPKQVTLQEKDASEGTKRKKKKKKKGTINEENQEEKDDLL